MIEVLEDGRILVYIDDIVLWGMLIEREEVWQRTLALIGAVAAAGFMINIRKSKLMTKRA